MPTWATPSLAPRRPWSYLCSQSCLIFSYCLIKQPKFNIQNPKIFFLERERESPILTSENASEIALPACISQTRLILLSWFIFLRFSSDPFTFSHESQLGEARQEKEERNGKNETVSTWPHFSEREMGKKQGFQGLKRKMNVNNWMINLYQSVSQSQRFLRWWNVERQMGKMKNAERKERNWSSRKEKHFNLVWWATMAQSNQPRFIIEEREAKRTQGDGIKDKKQPKQQKTTNTTRYEGQVPTNGHAYTAVDFGFSLSSISAF